MLLRRIIQAVDLHSRYLAKRFGLTGPQLAVLEEIARGGGITAGEVARAVSLSQATVTGILERLHRRDLIVRHRSTVDRRRVILEMTAGGRRLLDEAPPAMGESFLWAFNRLPGWEQSMILSALQRLAAMMEPGGGRDPAPLLTPADPAPEI